MLERAYFQVQIHRDVVGSEDEARARDVDQRHGDLAAIPDSVLAGPLLNPTVITVARSGMAVGRVKRAVVAPTVVERSR